MKKKEIKTNNLKSNEKRRENNKSIVGTRYGNYSACGANYSALCTTHPFISSVDDAIFWKHPLVSESLFESGCFFFYLIFLFCAL